MTKITDLAQVKLNIVTQAQYDDALVHEEIQDNEFYLITDAPLDIPVDDFLSSSSINPVQNKVIASALAEKIDYAMVITNYLGET